jgi:transposase
MIAPHRAIGRTARRTVSSPLYRRRWKIERLVAWLQNFRRLTVRWEHPPDNFLGMLYLACAITLMRHL